MRRRLRPVVPHALRRPQPRGAARGRRLRLRLLRRQPAPVAGATLGPVASRRLPLGPVAGSALVLVASPALGPVVSLTLGHVASPTLGPVASQTLGPVSCRLPTLGPVPSRQMTPEPVRVVQ